MRRTNLAIFIVLLSVICVSACVPNKKTPQKATASVGKARMLNNNGLTKAAKTELINVIFGSTPDSEKAEAYYMLGSISFKQNDVEAAMNAWDTLTRKYPSSKQAKKVKPRIETLSQVATKTTDSIVNNAVALSYFEHAQFWSSDKKESFAIDASWINNADAAIHWYDKIISEFPRTKAAKVAYQEKMKTIIGWHAPGRYGSNYGIKDSFSKYMPELISTFKQFKESYPNAPSLQAFRYQIAQVYWGKKDWKNTRIWLNKIVHNPGNGTSFYKDLAKRRLEKVKY